MSAWRGKYAIGLTGNIATGKSVVRKMLEHLGAYGIDADVLSHRAISEGAPGYQNVIDTFGKWVLGENGEIDRRKLGRLVFADPEAMAKLEEIVHPLVRKALHILVERSEQRIVVIEAIKLLETDLHTMCDQIWVTRAAPSIQLKRLIEKREISKEEAQRRIESQPPTSEKVKKADVIIENDASFEKTWNQVLDAWEDITQAEPEYKRIPKKAFGDLDIQRATPEQTDQIAGFINKHTKGRKHMTRSDVMAAFGEKAYMLLLSGEEIVGLLGWQVENLITRVDDVMIKEGVNFQRGLQALLKYVEEASRELQSEAALLFLPPLLAQHEGVWHSLGYRARTVKDLGVRAWQNAVMESMPPGTVLLFKQLREDRILRPMQ
ncbi:MAG: dephospho-CoA kinase [Anaerolineales bacterium]|nr:dephospho-CoA kinase [Anaerolineales bacterium]MBS3753651.1 dephospho-CoA kinase [Anaerolineales bacterium]